MLDLAVLVCVLRATTKKGRQLFCLALLPIFSSRTATAPGPGEVSPELLTGDAYTV